VNERPLSAPLLRRLDLRVRRRIAGLMPGDVRSLLLGAGTELAQIRPYRPGDDVRTIDWKVTARTGEPHVRVHVAERALTTWLVLDRSASMAFGTQDRTKAEVAEGVVLALSWAATSGADRAGVIAFDSDARVAVPPTGDRRSILRALGSVEERSAGSATRAAPVGAGLELAARVCRRPGAIVVVSDLRGPLDWRPSLARLALRHHVLVVEVVDEREQRLVDASELVLADPETGRQLRVDTSEAGLRARFEAAAAAEREEVRRAVASAGAEHVALSTSGDWLLPLATFLGRRRRVA
jgi:uncharacterized protein (DUF58 family)